MSFLLFREYDGAFEIHAKSREQAERYAERVGAIIIGEEK